MTVQLVLQLTALSHASLEPDGDALGDIKGISTAGQIPYQDTRQNPLFVMEVEVQRPTNATGPGRGQAMPGTFRTNTSPEPTTQGTLSQAVSAPAVAHE